MPLVLIVQEIERSFCALTLCILLVRTIKFINIHIINFPQSNIKQASHSGSVVLLK